MLVDALEARSADGGLLGGEQSGGEDQRDQQKDDGVGRTAGPSTSLPHPSDEDLVAGDLAGRASLRIDGCERKKQVLRLDRFCDLRSG